MNFVGNRIYPLNLTERQLEKLEYELEGALLEGIDDELELILSKVKHLHAKVKEDVLRETTLIRQALNAAGYDHQEPTYQNLYECFRDFVDAAVWSDLTLDDIEGMSVTDMARALIRYKG